MPSTALLSQSARYTGSLRRFPGIAGLSNPLRRPIQGPVKIEALRDSGARREVQGYATAAPLEAGAARRLHRIADAARWLTPRM